MSDKEKLLNAQKEHDYVYIDQNGDLWVKTEKLTAIEKKVDELIEKYKDSDNPYREWFIEDLKQIKELL